MWTLPELHYTPKIYFVNGTGSITSQCSRPKDPARTCRADMRTREISGIKPENRNKMRAFLLLLLLRVHPEG